MTQRFHQMLNGIERDAATELMRAVTPRLKAASPQPITHMRGLEAQARELASKTIDLFVELRTPEALEMAALATTIWVSHDAMLTLMSAQEVS